MTFVMAGTGRMALPATAPATDDGGMNTRPALEVRGAAKRFGPVTAVDDVSFTVPVGQVVALLGPNGAGKTTLLDMVLGFTTPDAGSIEVLGGSPAATARRGGVGAMLQSGGLLKDLTVAETLRMLAVCHQHALDELVRDGDKTVTGTWIAEESPAEVALALGLDPDAVTVDDGAVTFSAPDGDALALHLLSNGMIRDIEVHARTVEKLFFELTGTDAEMGA